MRLPACILITLCVAGPSRWATADAVLFRYEADVHPNDPAGGFSPFNPCAECTDFIEDGHYVIEWTDMGDQVNHSHEISRDPEPGPPTLGIEWRYRSNRGFGPGDFACGDGRVSRRDES